MLSEIIKVKLDRQSFGMAYSTRSASNTQHVAVVGAGLAGLATGIFLRRLNFAITIFESRPQDASDGGFLSLAPNAAHVLNQLGLYQSLLSQGFAYEEFTFLSGRNGSRIGSTLNGSVDRYGYPALRVSRHILRRTLLEAAINAGVKVQFDQKVVELAESATDVSITLASGEESSFNYLMACDGIHSRLRKIVFPSAPQSTFTGQVAIGGGSVLRSSIPANIPQPCLWVGASSSFMMMPTNPDGSTVAVSVTVETEDRTRQEWDAMAADKTHLKQQLVDRYCGAQASWPLVVSQCSQAADAMSLTIWPFYNASVLESWISNHKRVILIGDAAHAMPPTGGQGAAMAFEDAASLSLVFSKLSSGDVDIRTDLMAWQTRRQERVKRVRAFTTHGGDVRRGSNGRLQQLIKEWLMWAFFLVKGKEGGFAWIYRHQEQCPPFRAVDSKTV